MDDGRVGGFAGVGGGGIWPKMAEEKSEGVVDRCRVREDTSDRGPRRGETERRHGENFNKRPITPPRRSIT